MKRKFGLVVIDDNPYAGYDEARDHSEGEVEDVLVVHTDSRRPGRTPLCVLRDIKRATR